MPLISVIITTYNRERYIKEAIQSVLTSTFKDYELIISDNCSTDRTVAWRAPKARGRNFWTQDRASDYRHSARSRSRWVIDRHQAR